MTGISRDAERYVRDSRGGKEMGQEIQGEMKRHGGKTISGLYLKRTTLLLTHKTVPCGMRHMGRLGASLVRPEAGCLQLVGFPHQNQRLN